MDSSATTTTTAKSPHLVVHARVVEDLVRDVRALLGELLLGRERHLNLVYGNVRECKVT